jgi:hypothetical protein
VVRSKESAAYLLFNSPDPKIDTTCEESAQSVASLLKNFGVSVAILNACDSARANCGDGANIAKAFNRQGVSNVLAMSFKTSSTAAELFLRSFYYSLLLGGDPFSVAARRARSTLRRDSTRQARFGLERSLADSFVPVVYTSGADSVFVFPTEIGLGNTKLALGSESAARKCSPTKLVGREFDLLRLERTLLARRVIHFSGRAGVGKSSLLKHAAKLWKQTSFVDGVIIIDLATLNFHPLADLLNSLIQQTPIPGLPMRELQTEIEQLLESPGYTLEGIAKLICTAWSKLRLVLIFDGLHIFYSCIANALQSGATKDSVLETSRFMGTIIDFVKEEVILTDLYLIFVTRWSITPQRLRDALNYDFTESHFKLESLRLSDSLELAQQTLRKSDQNVEGWANHDLNELELLMGLLDCNPSAILQVLPEFNHLGLPWREFRGTVHCGILQHVCTASAQMVCKEIYQFFRILKDEGFSILLLLSTFWSEAPSARNVLEMAQSLDITMDTNIGIYAIVLAFELGVIELEESTEHREIAWIHPLFTLCGRAVAHETFLRQSLSVPHPAQPSSSVRKLGVSSPAGIRELAAAMVLSTLGLIPRNDLPTEIQPLAKDFAETFMVKVCHQVISRLLETLMRRIGYQDLFSSWSAEPGNLATCIAICTRAPYLPIDRWPLDLFEHHVSNIRIVGSPAQITDIALGFERLLDLSIELNSGLAFAPAYQYHAMHMSACLAAVYHCEVPVAEKSKKYVQQALDIFMASEKQYGKIVDGRVQYLKALALRYQCIALLRDGSVEQSKQLWQEMLVIDKSIFENSHSFGPKWSEDTITLLAGVLSTDDEDAQAAAKRLNALSSGSLFDAYYRSRKDSLRLITAAASTIEKGDDYLNSGQFRRVMAKVGDSMENIHDAATEMGFKEMKEDTRWWPERFDMNLFIQQLDNPTQRLDALENAKDSGDLGKASQQQIALLWEAYKSLDLDEAQEHIDALIRISERQPIPGMESVDLQRGSELIHNSKVILEAMTSKPENPPTDTIMVNALDERIKLFKDMNAPVDTVQAMEISREMWLKEIESQKGEGSAISGIFDDQTIIKMQSMMKSLSTAIRDPKFVQEMPAKHLECQKKLKRLHEAVLEEDWEAVLDCLQEVEDYSSQPGNQFISEFLDAEWISDIRLSAQWNLAKRSLPGRYSEAMARGDYDSARSIVLDFERELDPELMTKYGRDKLPKLLSLTESWPLQFTLMGADSLRESGKNYEAAEAYDALLQSLEESTFLYLDNSEVRKFKFGAKLQGYLSRYFGAIEDKSWEEGARLSEEILALENSNPDLAPSSYADISADLKEYCEYGYHCQGWNAAARRFDAEECQRHLEGLRALRAKQEVTPNMSRLLTPVLPEMRLKGMERWISIFRFGRSVAGTVRGWLGNLGVGQTTLHENREEVYEQLIYEPGNEAQAAASLLRWRP